MNENTAIVQAGTIPDDVKQMAALIRAMLPNGMNLTEQEALAGAMYGKAHGLDPFKGEYFIIPKKGIYPGYRGEMKQAGAYYTQTRPLRGDEATEHEIMAGDSARIVEVYQPEMMRQMRVLGMQYQPIVGVGIVRKAEKYTTSKWVNGQRVNLTTPEPLDPPTGRSWAWKAEQRALKDALRHMQGGDTILNETTDDLLREADEKAQVVVGEFRQMTEAEQRAAFAANVATMRGPQTDDPLGIDQPGNGNGHAPEPSADEMFDAMTSASEERAETHNSTTQATIDGAVGIRFGKWAEKFAEAYPSYRKDGKADMFHILKAAKAEQFDRITTENVTAVCDALRARAEAKVAGK